MRIVDPILQHVPGNLVNHSVLTSLIPGSSDKRAGLIKRAIASGDIIHLRKGLYCLAEKYRRSPLNMFEVAQQIYGPSYVSLQSALAYHGWIPEAVYSFTNASMKRSCSYKTPVGTFSYSRVPAKIFYEDVDRIELDKKIVFLMARPFRALLDYMYVYKKTWDSIEPLEEDLRIDRDLLRSIRRDELRRLKGCYPSKRVERFISIVARELGYEH